MEPRFLIVEDDAELRGILVRGLAEEGFGPGGTATGTDLLRRAVAAPADALVVDIGLPDTDGRDLCQALRAQGVEAPVLFLTARDALVERLAGFNAGGDDYLTKPFAFAELRTRLFLAALGAVGVAVVAMTVAFNLLLGRSLSHNADAVARARAGAQLAALRPTTNGLATGETPDEALGESPFWVFSRGKTLEAARSPEVVTAAARSLAGGRSRFLDVGNADVRLYSVPAVFEEKRLRAVVAGVALPPDGPTRRTAPVGFPRPAG